MLATANPPAKTSFADLARQIGDRLRDDSRVTDVQVPDMENDWCSPGTIFPSPADDHGLITGHDEMKRLCFNEAISFRIEVPAKNQRLVSEGDEIPTQYRVLWDGVTILVTWTAPSDEPIPRSGGHVASDILRGALEKVNLQLYVQGCSPECKHEFAHTDIRFIKGQEGQKVVKYSTGRWTKEVEATYPPTESDPADKVSVDLSLIAEQFAHLKNRGRRILEMEQDGRSSLSRLMATNLRRAEISLLPWYSRPVQLWKFRGWRRQSRRLISRVWATLGNIERLRREWDQARFAFDSRAAKRGRAKLFELDYADEVDRVSSFDPDLMRSAVQEAGDRLDNRALLLVTGIGAVAGAIAGGIVGGIAGNGF